LVSKSLFGSRDHRDLVVRKRLARQRAGAEEADGHRTTTGAISRRTALVTQSVCQPERTMQGIVAELVRR